MQISNTILALIAKCKGAGVIQLLKSLPNHELIFVITIGIFIAESSPIDEFVKR